MPSINDDYRLENGQLPSYTDLGGYPLFYICKDNSALCPDCANAQETQDRENTGDPDYFTLDSETIVAYAINYEDAYLYCDACSKFIESAYGEQESEDNNEVSE